MDRQKRPFTPLEIPKQTPLEREAKWSLTRRRFPRGITFVELIVIVLFLGIFAVIAVPRLQFATLYRKKADTVARKIVTDLRRTRRLAISDAANNTNGFALKMFGSAPYSTYKIVTLFEYEHGHWGQRYYEAEAEVHTIDPAVSCTGGATFQFGPLGNLLGGSDTQLTVGAEGKTFTITVISATGAVKCEEN